MALGAASFIVFSAPFPNEMTPSRVGAQVVSGIGFLGAGINFRSGFNVHGINTAATLWYSAAIGILAGLGVPWHALLATFLVIFVNLGLRPLGGWIKRRTGAGQSMTRDYRLSLRCEDENEARIRTHVLKALKHDGVPVTGLDRSHSKKGLLKLDIDVTVNELSPLDIHQLVTPLLLDPVIEKIDWQRHDDG